jgi:CubicO group peptidase (beta-lactamase class C family)
MSLFEKAGQLILLRQHGPDTEERDSLLSWAEEGRFGGLWVSGVSFNDYLNFTDSVRRFSGLPPFIVSSEKVLLHNQFSDLLRQPNPYTVGAMGDDTLKNYLNELLLQQIKGLGINMWVGPSMKEREEADLQKMKALETARVLTIGNRIQGSPVDTALFTDRQQAYYRKLLAKGLAGIVADSVFLHRHLPAPLPNQFFRQFLLYKFDYQGLNIAQATSPALLDRALQSGADLLIVNDDAAAAHEQLMQRIAEGVLSRDELDARVRKILLAKSWMRKGLQRQQGPSRFQRQARALRASVAAAAARPEEKDAATPELLQNHFTSRVWEMLRRRIYENALTVASNPHRLLPVGELRGRRFRLLQYSRQPFREFETYFEKYADFETMEFSPDERGRLPAFTGVLSEGDIGVMLLDEYLLHGRRDSVLIAEMRRLGKEGRLLLVNFQEPANLTYFDSSLTVVQLYERNDVNEQLAAQSIFGAVPAAGRLPVDINDYFQKGLGVKTKQTRLQYAPPEAVGIAPEKLVGVDAIARTAIDDGVAPGFQVLLAKNGKVIYSNNFGFHTFKRKQEVRSKDLYDLASITKISATTLAAMKLYDEEAYELDDRLKKHLSCDRNSTIKNIPLRKLFVHQSGLQPHMPVIPYLLYRDRPNRGCDKYFCREGLEPFTVQVADEFYFDRNYLDTIWQEVHRLRVGSRRRYRYSDVNFMLIQRMIEEKTGQPLDRLVEEQFYGPLGLRYTTFKPTERFDLSQIVPTQYDGRWRQQLVHGFVHDETAALMGGVGGNAGLFGTAEDLAVIFQMLLNGGTYGGQQYLSPETIELFTSARHGNHRGLGFDKPYRTNESAVAASAPPETFGHTGFTGTCVWVDPTEELIFVFLSNRIHPTRRNSLLFRKNVRRRIHEVVYDALDSYYDQIPMLEPVAGS